MPKKTQARIQREVIFYEAIGSRLRIAREALGCTRSEWAAKYGALRNAQCQWEAGIIRPDILFLIRLCEDYGLSMDYFLRGAGAGQPFSLTADLDPAVSESALSLVGAGHSDT